MQKIALTGGIGVGKTTVAAEFEKLGVPVFYSDDEAKKIYSRREVQEQINAILPEPVFNDSGALNKDKFRKYLFESSEIRNQVNSIVHPLVRAEFKKFCKQNAMQPYVLNEAALHIESGSWRNFDKVILITAPLQIRIDRLIGRDGSSKEEIELKIRAQMTEEEKAKFADFIFNNDGLSSIIDFVQMIHNQFI